MGKREDELHQQAQEVLAVIITNKLFKQGKVSYNSKTKEFTWKKEQGAGKQ